MDKACVFHYLKDHHIHVSPNDTITGGVYYATILITDDWNRYQSWLSHKTSDMAWLRERWKDKQLIFIGIKAN
jgi:hypothetical protein